MPWKATEHADKGGPYGCKDLVPSASLKVSASAETEGGTPFNSSWALQESSCFPGAQMSWGAGDLTPPAVVRVPEILAPAHRNLTVILWFVLSENCDDPPARLRMAVSICGWARGVLGQVVLEVLHGTTHMGHMAMVAPGHLFEAFSAHSKHSWLRLLCFAL